MLSSNLSKSYDLTCNNIFRFGFDIGTVTLIAYVVYMTTKVPD